VPAAVDDDPLIPMNHGPVAVTDPVHARNRHSAAFGVEKINRLENRFAAKRFGSIRNAPVDGIAGSDKI